MRHKKNYPKNHADDRQSKNRMIEGVYAGPDFFAQQKPQMFQKVYAGPPFPAGQDPQMFQMVYAAPSAPPPADLRLDSESTEADAKPHKWCVECGMRIDEDAKFCTECGAPQPRGDA